MPIYEYVCTSCGKEFEAIQKFSDDPITECACGERGAVERKLSLSAFQLKGGGWYKDQYSTSGGGSNGKSTSPASTSDSSKDSGSGAAACGAGCACATA